MDKLINLNGLLIKQLKVLFILIICTYITHAQTNYFPNEIYSEGVRDVKSVDINQDGAIDVLMASYDKVGWLENDGNENFIFHELPANTPPIFQLDYADFNQDGAIDIVATYRNSTGLNMGMIWYKNDGNENFTKYLLDNAAWAYCLSVTDVDGNGTMDIISSSDETFKGFWYDNDGNGNFTKRMLPDDTGFITLLSAGDLDNDGDEDIVVCDGGFSKFYWYENIGNGNFVSRSIELDPFYYFDASEFFLDDLDQDGNLDILVINNYFRLSWFKNNGGGSFTKNEILADDHLYTSFSTIDWDNDGDKDLLTSSGYYGNFISVWDNDGNENFTRYYIASNFSGTDAVAVDIDYDGDQDIIGGASNRVSIFKACIGADDTPPSLICKDPTIELDANGQHTFALADLVQISSDDCSPVTFISASPSIVDCADATNTLPVMVTVQDGAGNTANCTANVTVEEGTSLPDGWQGTDIGQSSTNNDYAYGPCSQSQPEYTITGGGNNTTSMLSDNVAFSSYSICGDGSITAKIESVDPNGYGGLMIRESMDTGAKQVSIFSNMTNNLRHESRSTTNGMKQVNSFFKLSPIWLKLERQGDWVFTYYSSTGVNFQYVHAVFVPMQSCVEFGLASFTYIPGSQTAAVFSNVSITGSNGGSGNNNSIVNNESNQEPSSSTTPHEHLKPKTLPNTGPFGNLFPNPNNGQFTLKMDEPTENEGVLTIYTPYGQQIYKESIEAGFTQKQIDLRAAPVGMYLLEYKGENVQRVIKRFNISR